MVSFLVGFVIRLFLVGSALHLIVMGICFGNVPFLLLLRSVKIFEFHDLMSLDEAHWPRCLLWHGWQPMLSGSNSVSPWAGHASESANYLVEAALGGYSSRLVTERSPPGEYDQVAVSSLVPVHPNVWSDGSLVLDQVIGVSSSGAGFLC